MSWFAYLKSIYADLTVKKLLDQMFKNFESLPALVSFLNQMRDTLCLFLGSAMVSLGEDTEAIHTAIFKLHVKELLKLCGQVSIGSIRLLIGWCKKIAQFFGQVSGAEKLGKLSEFIFESVECVLNDKSKRGESVVKILSGIALGLTFPSMAPFLYYPIVFKIATFLFDVVFDNANLIALFDTYDLSRAGEYISLMKDGSQVFCAALDKDWQKSVCKNTLYYFRLLFGNYAVAGMMLGCFMNVHIFVELARGHQLDDMTLRVAKHVSCMYSFVGK